MKIILMRNMLLLLITIGSFSSCVNCITGEGDIISEERTLKDFEVIVLKSSADVVIHQNKLSNTCEAIVNAQKNLQPYIQTKVEGSKLIIDIEGCIEAKESIEIEVAFNELSKIVLSGSGDLSSSNILKCDELKISQDGSGDISLKIKGKELEIDQNGSGDLNLAGDYDEIDVESDGSGDINARDLKTNKAKLSNDGSGNIVIFVKESLDINLDGSGDIKYYGSPIINSQIIEGSGEVKEMD